ncbi:hypothetical protein PVK06_019792 [Gossypium arboreum]|uniref:DUF4371 domain-containing protein n=1 Tax=Gossypium arboreum TaxID=29729 RepID=A0ABR0PKP0_GOSAR|nr:hypothetical protein PVK06_019792 [Gossypium arboreum]
MPYRWLRLVPSYWLDFIMLVLKICIEMLVAMVDVHVYVLCVMQMKRVRIVMKSKTIDSFFKKKSTETTQLPSEVSQIDVPPSSFAPLNSDARPSKISRVEDKALDLSNLEREPGLCHDESSGSKNCGNFLELLSLLASYDEKVEDVLKSAPQNASYTSSTIQKEILHIYASRVRNVIREEIGDRKFSIIMDEERDESKKEQMAIILRFFDKQRQVKERFFDIVHVKDTASLTLKKVIFNVLLQHSFDIQNIRGQGYDGASNMRGEFNGLQALILNDCRYAYYVHCFSHHLQLALLQEFKSRFNKNVVDLLTLTTALDPKEFFKLFDIDKICILVNKFYPEEFSQQEKERLPYELKHYELDVCKHPDLRKISTLSELCRSLVESGKSVMYPLVDRFIRLILTRLRSKMEDDFLRSSLVMYIEKEIAEKFDINEIIDDFSKVKARRVQFK